MRRPNLVLTMALAVFFLPAAPAAALAPETVSAIDDAVKKVLDETGVPGVSVAVVRDGTISLAKAYGLGRLDPPTQASPAMRFPIGSISKQFTAAAMAMLAADGRLGLDDKLSRFFPDLTRAGDITLRQLLSHTAGIRDFWPQDYVPPAMLEATTPEALMDRWARLPLDFEPGSKYQYSNTGYVVAAAVVEKASGRTLMELLRERVFKPLGMETVLDVDQGRLSDGDATGYLRYGLGPLRPAPKEGKGWMLGAGDLAMTAEDLARWDVSLIEGRVPGPAVFREMTREAILASGVGAGYGLGVALDLKGDRRVVSHGGEMSGFTSENRVYPEDRAAIVVLTNQDAVDAAETIADGIAERLFIGDSPADAEMLEKVKAILEELRKGRVDRSLLTANANAYFTEQALRDFSSGLKRLGSVKEVKPLRQSLRGGLTTRVYRAVLGKKKLRIVTRAAPDGRLEQLTLSAE